MSSNKQGMTSQDLPTEAGKRAEELFHKIADVASGAQKIVSATQEGLDCSEAVHIIDNLLAQIGYVADVGTGLLNDGKPQNKGGAEQWFL